MTIIRKKLEYLVLTYIFPYGYSQSQFKRTFKAALLTTVCFMLACINPVDNFLGDCSYLCALTSVSIHPGRRLGAMIQSMILGLVGIILGIAYSVLVHLIAKHVYIYSSLNLQTAFYIFIFFEAFIFCLVGYVRSSVPKFFPLVYVLFLVTHFSFLQNINTSLISIVYNFSVPFVICIALSCLINVMIFPEFGSTYIGTTVLNSIHEIHVMFSSTSYFFINLNDHPDYSIKYYTESLTTLINQKQTVRSSLAQCSATMLECTYEFSYSFMAPQELKPLISNLYSLNNTINALHVACELVLSVFVGHNCFQSNANTQQDDDPGMENSIDPEKKNSRNFQPSQYNDLSELEKILYEDSKEYLKRNRPHKEANYADYNLLLDFVTSVKAPVSDVTKVALQAFNHTKYILAYTYDADFANIKFSSLVDDTFENYSHELHRFNYSLSLQKIDEYLSQIQDATHLFATAVRQELTNISDHDLDYIYLVPREEFFVLSLFILNFRETTVLISKILLQARTLLELRMKRQQKGWKGRKIWFSVLNLRKDWNRFMNVKSGEFAESKPVQTVFNNTDNKFETHHRESHSNAKSQTDKLQRVKRSFKRRFISSIQHTLYSSLEFFRKRKLHFQSAFRTVLLLNLVTFPGYSAKMHDWYHNIRGTWVGFAALVALETNVGATTTGVITRTICVILSSAWGYALYIAGKNAENRYLMVGMTFIGLLPLYYFMLYSPYSRACIMGLVSLTTVPLSTLRNHGIQGTVLVNFAKRCLAMIIGGTAATIINATVFPQTARTQLVDQIICALKYCQYIQIQLAAGLDNNGDCKLTNSYGHRETNNNKTIVRDEQAFTKYLRKARASLQSAETLLEFASSEPRLKGNYSMYTEIYTEMIFVLHQILDRCNNIKFLRKKYGSVVLDELSVSFGFWVEFCFDRIATNQFSHTHCFIVVKSMAQLYH